MSESAKEQIVIKDACVLFDLLDLGLLTNFYQLELTVITTQEVIDEIKDGEQLAQIQPYIDNDCLQIDRMGVFESVIAIIEVNRGLSFTDASVLETALRREAAILSSDKSLRNESKRRGLNVKGVLWIIEELYCHDLISYEMAIEKLKLYPSVNNRAPQNEIEKLLVKLTKSKTDIPQ